MFTLNSTVFVTVMSSRLITKFQLTLTTSMDGIMFKIVLQKICNSLLEVKEVEEFALKVTNVCFCLEIQCKV